MTLRTDHDKKSMRHIEVKVVFLHWELGIKAGLERRSCRPTQAMKAGTMAREIVRRVMLEASFMLAALPVNALSQG